MLLLLICLKSSNWNVQPEGAVVLLVRSPAAGVIEQFLYPTGAWEVIARQQCLISFWFHFVARTSNASLCVLLIASQPEARGVSFLLFCGFRSGLWG